MAQPWWEEMGEKERKTERYKNTQREKQRETEVLHTPRKKKMAKNQTAFVTGQTAAKIGF